ncbi:MAG: TatD family deoxyribonuclease [Acidimicrobiia bacterium]|nr:TatD family deoxyribonuclease [Acidimicrobiia bacterium]
MVDSHCHIADEAFADDFDAVVARSRAAGITRVMCILSSDAENEFARVPVVQAAWPEVCYATAVHPHRAGAYAGRIADVQRVVRAAATRANAVALGEMGLEYHYDKAPRDVQHEVFAAQIALAVELGLPIAIHTREATEDTHAILREAGQGRVRGVMHCFTGTQAEATRALDLGFYLSIPGIVTFPKAGALRDVVRTLPEDRLLVETDAPYLAPVPFRGKRNEPAFLTQTVAAIAELRGVTAVAMGERLRLNFDAFLGARRVDTPAKAVV